MTKEILTTQDIEDYFMGEDFLTENLNQANFSNDNYKRLNIELQLLTILELRKLSTKLEMKPTRHPASLWNVKK